MTQGTRPDCSTQTPRVTRTLAMAPQHLVSVICYVNNALLRRFSPTECPTASAAATQSDQFGFSRRRCKRTVS